MSLRDGRGRIFNCLKVCLHRSPNDDFVINLITFFFIQKAWCRMSYPNIWLHTKFGIGSKHSKQQSKVWKPTMLNNVHTVLNVLISLDKSLAVWGCHVRLQSISTPRNLSEVTKLYWDERWPTFHQRRSNWYGIPMESEV